jgi:hypothetical protein
MPKRKNSAKLKTAAQIEAAMPAHLWAPTIDQWSDPVEGDPLFRWILSMERWTEALQEWCAENGVAEERFQYTPMGHGDLYRTVKTP